MLQVREITELVEDILSRSEKNVREMQDLLKKVEDAVKEEENVIAKLSKYPEEVEARVDAETRLATLRAHADTLEKELVAFHED